MPTEVAYLPLKGASSDARTTKANMQWPSMVKLDNFNSSSSTETPTIRQGIVGKTKIPHIIMASGAKNWLNTIVPQPNIYTQSLLTRFYPGVWSDSVEGSLRCTKTEYTVSISGYIVTRLNGPGFMSFVRKGDFFKFPDNDIYYDVETVYNDSQLKLYESPGDTDSMTCTLYTTYCPYRAQWPLKYDKYGDVHIYHACDPTGNSPQESMRSPFQKTIGEFDTIVTTTGNPTSIILYSVSTGPLANIGIWATSICPASSGNLYALKQKRYYDDTRYLYVSSNNGQSWSQLFNDDERFGGLIAYDQSTQKLMIPVFKNSELYDGNLYRYVAAIYDEQQPSTKWYIRFAVNSVINRLIIKKVLFDGTFYVLFGGGLGPYESHQEYSACLYIRASGLVQEPTNPPQNNAIWVPVNGSGINDAVLGSSKYIAVGNSGSIITARISIPHSWTERNGANKSYDLRAITKDSTTTGYVTVGTNGTILESTDATTWNQADSGVTTNLNSVCYGNSMFVAVGDNGVILTSADRMTWVQQTSGVTINLASVCWDGSRFYASSMEGIRDFDWEHPLLISTDGVTWSQIQDTRPGALTDLAIGPTYGSVYCVASASEPGSVVYPIASKNWAHKPFVSLVDRVDCNGIARTNSLYVAVGAGGKIATSTNGSTWVEQTSGVSSDLYGVCYSPDAGKWIVVGDAALLTSSDAMTWSDDSALIPATITDARFRRVRYIQATGMIVAVGYDQTKQRAVSIYSTDATSWTHAVIAGEDFDEFYDISYNQTTSEYIWCGTSAGSEGCLWRNESLDYANGNITSHPNFVVTDITGMTHTNSDWGVLYATWSEASNTLDWYSDPSRTVLVATGSGGVGDTITMSESGGSGLSGTVEVSAEQSGDLQFTIRTEYNKLDMQGFMTSSVRSVCCNGDNIVFAGIGNSACGYFTSDYSRSEMFVITANCYSVIPAQTPEQYESGAVTDSYWIGSTNGTLYLATIGNQVTTAQTVYSYQLTQSIDANDFIILDGYVVLLGTRELTGSGYTYYPRRIRWTVPGTYNDFSGFGSGTQDIPGFGDFLTAGVVEHTGVIFERGGIGAINWTGESDPTAGPIWTYRQIAKGITTISNIVSHEGSIWFVGNNGLLYRTNGVEVAQMGGGFDLSKFTEFPPTTPVQMVLVPTTRQLAILVQSSDENSEIPTYVDNTIYMINVDSGRTTTWTVSAPGQRLSLVQVIGADSPGWIS